ncbi:unnamed protein product [Tuber melanosporum]|uniref:DNA-directed DNA polymerase n=1 Tax=Tuber melanosporum (strain Mel28) TaxID=656061 RepID=D5GNV0_TUBMM|nr:uncharacterized protein GSTUM_00011520001 [Tuber melanosporum]CAZ86193.1 unnamed protein product [Tuber melanosporum]
MDSRGIETVRLDNLRPVQVWVKVVLRWFLINRGAEGAHTYVKDLISDPLQHRIDMS